MLRQRVDRLETLTLTRPVDILFTWQEPTPRALEKVARWRRSGGHRAAFFWVDGDEVTPPGGDGER